MDAMMAKVEGGTANIGRFFRDGTLENEIDLSLLP
jgi:hypothetical protein